MAKPPIELPTFITGVNLTNYEPDDQAVDLDAIIAGVDQISQNTMLLKKRKELREVTESLVHMQEEYSNRMETCAERQKQFLRRQTDMKEQLLRFGRFIQENDIKVKKANLKIIEEDKLCDEYDKTIKELQRKYNDLKSEKTHIETKLDRLKKYKEYLTKVVDESKDDYTEISDILSRYYTLYRAYTQLRQSNENLSRDIEARQIKSYQKQLSKQNEILTLSNQLHIYQKQLEELKVLIAQNEVTHENHITIKKDGTSISAQVILSVRNLFSRSYENFKFKTKLVEEHGRDEVDVIIDYLDLIQGRILDLSDISQGYEDYSGEHTKLPPPTQSQNNPIIKKPMKHLPHIKSGRKMSPGNANVQEVVNSSISSNNNNNLNNINEQSDT